MCISQCWKCILQRIPKSVLFVCSPKRSILISGWLHQKHPTWTLLPWMSAAQSLFDAFSSMVNSMPSSLRTGLKNHPQTPAHRVHRFSYPSLSWKPIGCSFRAASNRSKTSWCISQTHLHVWVEHQGNKGVAIKTLTIYSACIDMHSLLYRVFTTRFF